MYVKEWGRGEVGGFFSVSLSPSARPGERESRDGATPRERERERGASAEETGRERERG